MKNRSAAYKTVTMGLFIAIGLILPFFTSHAFGIPGTVLLPMHIPVLLCGLICGPLSGAITGAAVPLLSSFITGMPAPYPMLPIMVVQLFALGLLSGLLYRKIKLPIYPSIGIAMASGWALYGLVFAVLLLTGSGELRALSVFAALLQGIPGMAIQLILVPILVKAVDRRGVSGKKQKQENMLLDDAKAIIKSREASFIVVKHGKIVHTAEGRGVSPILRLYESDPEMLKGAAIADKIIGKGAAMILVLGKVKKIYGEVMSVAARDYLEERNIPIEYGRCVDVITARNDKGICPIEKSVLAIDDPDEGLAVLKKTIARLMEKAG